MHGFHMNIEKEAHENTDFRRVLYTGKHSQLVLMSLKPGEEIGEETHVDNDQFFRFESGMGRCVIDGNSYDLVSGDVVVIPAGSLHNITNMSDHEDLKMYTIYSPAHHKDGIVRVTKEEAALQEAEFDGVTTE